MDAFYESIGLLFPGLLYHELFHDDEFQVYLVMNLSSTVDYTSNLLRYHNLYLTKGKEIKNFLF